MDRKKLFKKIRHLVLVLFLVSLAGYIGYYYGTKRSGLDYKAYNSENQPAELSNFWLVWGKLEEKYLDKSVLEPEKMIQGAISGMVDALGDPYTVYLPPEDNEISQENLSGSFGGIGIRLGFKDKRLAVISPLKNTPAEKAGIEAGDYILKITDDKNDIDQTTEKISLPEAVKLIRGEVGDKVVLTLSRESRPEPFEVEIVRGNIEIPALETEWMTSDGKNFGYVHLLNFSESMTLEWDKWVDQVVQRNNDPDFGGLILDLRNNPGGYLSGAVYVAGEFLQRGQTVVWQEDYLGAKQKFEVQRAGRLIDIPLVVLVNQGSASASEILAGAIRHYGKGELVGTSTFGKGTIQEPEQLPDKSGLHITTAQWLLPDETVLDEDGLDPDVAVEIADNEDVIVEEDSDKDLILEKGIEWLNAQG